jgi:hypothetical protein
LDVDTLAAEVARATELIGWCRRRLAKAEQDVAEVLDDKKSPDNLQTRDTPQTPGAPQAPDNLQIPDDSKSSNTPQTPDTPKTQNNQ